MTNVIFEKNNGYWKIGMSGHAGSGTKGHDLACACESVLATILSQIIIDCDIKPDTARVESGECYFAFANDDRLIDSKIDTVLLGFELLAANYPDYVTLSTNVR